MADSEALKAHKDTPGSSFTVEQIAAKPKAPPTAGRPSTQDIHRIFAKGVVEGMQRRVDAFRLKLVSDRVAYASERGRLRDKHIELGVSYVEASRLASAEMDALGRVFPKVWDDNADVATERAKIETLRPMADAPKDGTLIVVKREDRVFGGIKWEPMVFEYGAWRRPNIEGVLFPNNPTLLGWYSKADLGLDLPCNGVKVGVH